MFHLTNGKLSTKAIQVMITNKKERIGQNECIKSSSDIWHFGS